MEGQLFQIAAEIFKQNGLAGLILAWVVYKDVIAPRKQKKELEHQHRRSDDSEPHVHKRSETETLEIKNRVDRIWDHMKYLESKVSDHLLKEAEEDIKMGVLETEQKNMKEKLEDTKEDIQSIFKILSEIKTLMIKSGA